MRLEELCVENKVVMVRTDYDIPVRTNGKMSDISRINESLKTIIYLLKRGAMIVICSSIGRPLYDANDNNKSLSFILNKLSELVGVKIKFADRCVGFQRDVQVAKLSSGDILLLENVRFFHGEYDNDDAFAKDLAKNVDIYINDAFSNSHRNHASMTGVPKFVPHKAIGFHARHEMEKINKYLEDPSRPSIGIIGGKKKDKIYYIPQLFNKFDKLIIAGKIANYFLAAKRCLLPCDEDEEVINKCSECLGHKDHRKFIISTDYIDLADSCLIDKQNCYDIFDITPAAIEQIDFHLQRSKKIFWNGPVGIYEKIPYENGSKEIVKSVFNTNANALVGGGDTVAMIKKYGMINNNTQTVLSGGALLSFVAYGSLIAIKGIQNRI